MLTDMILEEEFEIKDDEPWYDHQDLEHDLHLAAELGKTLLEQNRELEQGLQQMYGTNQEQLQEIEYLSKQVELQRSVNDQHAKVYEQLDVTTRDLEQRNQRLGQDNRAAQHNIQGLTEAVDALQAEVEDLQRQVEKLKAAPPEHTRPEVVEPRRLPSNQVASRSREQYPSPKHYYEPSPSSLQQEEEEAREEEEEHVQLTRSVQTLQSQLGAEQARRGAAEREADALARELAELEPRLARLQGCQARLAEAEAEVEELRLLWRADAARGARRLPADALFFPPEEGEQRGGPGHSGRGLKRSSSEWQLWAAVEGEEDEAATGSCGHRERAAGMQRSEAVKQRGISLLNEVDEQYSALQLKYDALLRRCQAPGAGAQSHKAVQTPTPGAQPAGPSRTHTRAVGTEDNDPQLPEYKALFHQVFTCIQKSKEDLKGNRAAPSQTE